MKQIENIFRTLFLFLTALVSVLEGKAQQADALAAMDSVEIGLLTCSPHEEIYSLYGHSALRYHDLRSGKERDVVFNYGIFNFNKPHFVLRFMFGLTDYELGLSSFDSFCGYYRRWGSQVVEQVLDLSREEKQRLTMALAENLLEENRIYRYNFFYDNCSTRPRDILERCIAGVIDYGTDTGEQPSYREMVHQYTAGHPWASFGNDILLGVKADLETTQRQRQFLPANLRHDVDRAIVNRNGSLSPLVKERRELVKPGVQFIEPGFPLSPTECALVLAVVSLLIFLWEQKKRKTMVWWDALLMLLVGLPGVIILLMFFSQHPTTSTNLTVLLLNPLPLFFIYKVVRRRKTRWFWIQAVLVCLFLVGALWQDYAEGLEIVALCLLLRFWRHLHDK